MTQTTAIRIGIGLDAAAHAARSGDSRAELWATLARQLDGEADFLTLEDGFGRHNDDGPDAVLLANWIGAQTRNIGIIAGAAANFHEPFHLSTAVATMDYVTEGRAGLLVQRLSGQSATDAARAAGSHPGFPAPDAATLERDTADAVAVIHHLWDSWEDDAVIRDQKTWRYLDGAKLHYIDFRSEDFSILGPSITPRPPQGQPVVATTLATGEDATAAPFADMIFAQPDIDHRPAIRSGESPLFVADTIIANSTADETVVQARAWAARGFQGIRFNLRDPQHDIAWLLTTALPALRDASLTEKPKQGVTLRERLGLSRPENRYTTAA